MIYRLLGDLVLLMHLAFIVFVLFGGMLTLRRRGWLWWHLPALGWAVLVELSGWICPLTPLENRLRALGGVAGYRGDFVEHYLLVLIYPEGLTRPVQLILAALAVLVNLAVYGYVVYRRQHGRGSGI